MASDYLTFNVPDTEPVVNILSSIRYEESAWQVINKIPGLADDLAAYKAWLVNAIGLTRVRNAPPVIDVNLREKPASDTDATSRGKFKYRYTPPMAVVEVYVKNIRSVEDLYTVISHEAIHILQTAAGDLLYHADTNSYEWVAPRVPPAVIVKPQWSSRYIDYRAQPHEREAWHNDKLLSQDWLKNFSQVKGDLCLS